MTLIISTTNDLSLVQLFGLWSSHSWTTVFKYKGGPLPKYLLFGWQCSPVQRYQVFEGGYGCVDMCKCTATISV